jgi:hypothetical protein
MILSPQPSSSDWIAWYLRTHGAWRSELCTGVIALNRNVHSCRALDKERGIADNALFGSTADAQFGKESSLRLDLQARPLQSPCALPLTLHRLSLCVRTLSSLRRAAVAPLGF